jgi:Fe-S-cluster containining protein
VTGLDGPLDRRSSPQRREALEHARAGARASELLHSACAPLEAALVLAQASQRTSAELWTELSSAYHALDRYIEHLVTASGLIVRCGPACSACCTDAPPTLAIEGLRMVRALRARADGTARLRRAVEHARRFQRMLLEDAGRDRATAADTTSEGYRRTQLAWRALGQPCTVLDHTGRCSAYDQRPLACRVHVSVDDPALCAFDHPRCHEGERPPVWGTQNEAQFERLLVAIGRALGLSATPNLPWALAALHDHPLVRAR